MLAELCEKDPHFSFLDGKVLADSNGFGFRSENTASCGDNQTDVYLLY